MIAVRTTPRVSRQTTPLMRRPTPQPLTPHSDGDAGGGPAQPLEKHLCGVLPPPQPGSLDRLRDVFASRPLACAVLLIAMSSVVKGAVEEMLPFHADHRWGYSPLEIGQLFCVVAIAYILATALCCNFWRGLGDWTVAFSAYWLLLLGIVAWIVFAVVSYAKSHLFLILALSLYGVCLGWTVTPANLLAASVIDHETGAAKDASNGIFQTMWEAGGSIGFLLGGLLAARYHEQMALLTTCSIGCVAVALIMVSIWSWPEDGCGEEACDCAKKRKEQENYGAAA